MRIAYDVASEPLFPQWLMRKDERRGEQLRREESTLEEVAKSWRGRRVFLTGHTGFKGSWLALWLIRLGAKLRGYALDPCTEPNMFTLAAIGIVVDDVRGDVRDYAKLEAAMTEFAPDVVFHLAAQPIVRRSYADPVGTYAANVMGTVHVLEAVRKTSSVRAVVCVTTDKCYQNQEWIWPYRENDLLGGYDPVCVQQSLRRNCLCGVPQLILSARPAARTPCGPCHSARRQCHWRW